MPPVGVHHMLTVKRAAGIMRAKSGRNDEVFSFYFIPHFSLPLNSTQTREGAIVQYREFITTNGTAMEWLVPVERVDVLSRN